MICSCKFFVLHFFPGDDEMCKIYETERLILKVLEEKDALQVLDYYMRNRDFLEEWELRRPKEFYTVEAQAEQLRKDFREFEEKRALRLWIYKKGDTVNNRVLGAVAFNNIVFGAFLSCFLGYKLDRDEVNKGYITEAIRKGIEIVFKEYGLHRIEANIMPRNSRSLRVVEKLGFYNEGLAYSYLKINGHWEDHIHMVLLNDRLE